MNVLVDTSVWSLGLRRKPGDLNAVEQAFIAELRQLIQEGRARMIGIVRQELLSGIKAAAQFEKLRVALRAFPDESIHTADHEAAAQASNYCRSKGIAVSLVDVLICTLAMDREWSVFTSDPDFRNFKKVLPLKLHTPRN